MADGKQDKDEAVKQAEEQQAPEASEGTETAEEVVAEVIENDESEEEGAGDSAPASEDEQLDIFTAIKKEVTDLRDKYARLQAEWDNYRKRTAAERKQERIRASENLVTDLLPVLDDLERAIKHAKDSGEGGSLTEGVEAVQTK